MNTSDNNSPKRQDCPYFPELLNNWQLRKELEKERRRRENAEKNQRFLSFVSLLFLLVACIAVTIFITHSGMSVEEISAYAALIAACSSLLFTFSMALTMVNVTLRLFAAWKRQKKSDKEN